MGCEVQAQTAKLFMWAKHRKHSFTGSKSCGRFTASPKSSFPSKPTSPTSIIRPLKQGLKRNCGFPPSNVWRTHTALKSGNCCLPPCPKRKSGTPALDAGVSESQIIIGRESRLVADLVSGSGGGSALAVSEFAKPLILLTKSQSGGEGGIRTPDTFWVFTLSRRAR